MKTMFFGSYWQLNSKEKEPIEWIVLKEDEDKIYLLSKYILECLPYDIEDKGWKNSFARKWLNEVFLNNAFSVKEQEQIVISNIKTSSDFGWNGRLDSGTAVQDKVFLPSRAEAIIYFDSEAVNDIIAEQKRIARPTNFAYEKGCCLWPVVLDESQSYWISAGRNTVKLALKTDAYEQETNGICWTTSWILRSAKNANHVIKEDGEIGPAFSPEYNHLGIRPALWMKK
jgi:hypothetical protein